tara:strand:+ start:3088 stop:3342 length:255 start_codon:yes stop_codon:yes gene_type:complete
MYKFKQFMLQAQKQKKCPPGYRFDNKLQVCVPTGVTRYYPYFGGRNGNGQNDQQSSDNNTNDNGTNGNGNGTNGNGSNGNGGGE